jgi:tRNA(Leu) C34 or U34 (ribose-2'-O)-methylase TrmL
MINPSPVIPEVHAAATERITITMQPKTRSLIIALACAMVAGEAVRQLS